MYASIVTTIPAAMKASHTHSLVKPVAPYFGNPWWSCAWNLIVSFLSPPTPPSPPLYLCRVSRCIKSYCYFSLPPPPPPLIPPSLSLQFPGNTPPLSVFSLLVVSYKHIFPSSHWAEYTLYKWTVIVTLNPYSAHSQDDESQHRWIRVPTNLPSNSMLN